jgi:hypothetical protein
MEGKSLALFIQTRIQAEGLIKQGTPYDISLNHHQLKRKRGCHNLRLVMGSYRDRSKQCCTSDNPKFTE